MKKFILLIFAFVLLISFSACKSDSSSNSSNINADLMVRSFSYADVRAKHKDGEPGIKTDGFKNTIEHKIETAEDALRLAKNEVSVSYDSTTVHFDNDEKVWKVEFWTQDQVGGDQTVYLNENGITLLRVSGE